MRRPRFLQGVKLEFRMERCGCALRLCAVPCRASSESMEADAQREGSFARDRSLEEDEDENNEERDGPRGAPGRTAGDSAGVPGAGAGVGTGAALGAGTVAVPLGARVSMGGRGGRETRGGTEAVDRASLGGAGATEHVGMFPDDRRRGSVGFGTLPELPLPLLFFFCPSRVLEAALAQEGGQCLLQAPPRSAP